LNHGAINDLFDEGWHKVLANIEDENTAANHKRSVIIEIAAKPDKTRRTREIKVQVRSTLAKINPVGSFVFFDAVNLPLSRMIRGRNSLESIKKSPYCFHGQVRVNHGKRNS
jgi:hypothetical protein